MNIVYYVARSGKVPFLEWRDSLDTKTRSIIIARLARVRLGNMGDCKPIKNGKGLWELRIDYGPGYRLYFGKKGSDFIVLLIGGDKDTQARDIERAKDLWIDCEELFHDKKIN